MKLTLIIFVLCFGIEMVVFPGNAFAQNENVFLHPKKFYKKFFPNLKIKRDPPDSSYIRSYPNYLSVGMHVLSPAIRMDINPRHSHESGASKFRTNIADIIGFSASYRFISAGFAVILKSGVRTHDDYARSYYRTATIKYNSSAYSLQFKYLRFRGFTDVNPINSNDPGNRYLRREDMVNKEFQFEGIYNFSWRKYSYVAPFTFSQRQVKSRMGFLLKPGVYYTQLSGDAPLIGTNQQPYYPDFGAIKVMRTLSIKLAPGMGGNFVFLRRYYFSLAAFPSYDLYLYKYLTHTEEKVKGKQDFVLVLDGKANVGYQSKRFYGGLRYEIERRNAVLHNLSINSIYTYLGVELGYRFGAPRIVKKIYKETMPPGM
jgi:hypothetical protein